MEKFIKAYTNKQLGFSLIEMILAILILTLLGMTIFAFQKNAISLNNIFSTSLIAQEEVRRVLRTISSEIRSASPSSVGSYTINQISDFSLIFYCDIDDDGLKEQIRYFLDGNIFKKGIIKPAGNPLVYNAGSEVVAEITHNVVNGSTPVFSYYDSNYDGTSAALTLPADVSLVRLIKITVIIDKDPATPPGPMMLTTQVSLRNLKDNL